MARIMPDTRKVVRTLALLFLLGVVQPCLAGPWVEPGDVRLRHDLNLLSDAGLLYIPLLTWPLAWQDIQKNLTTPTDSASPAARSSYLRVKNRLEQELYNEYASANARLAVAAKPVRFRTFRDTSRENAEAEAGLTWTGEYLAYDLQLTGVSSPDDGKSIRFDGSSAGILLGNWSLSIGALDRWWGPGWEGSLIMSNNARPIPAVIFRRNHSDPFDLPVLNWFGPWQLSFSMGRLEGSRHIPHALLMGIRLSFKPWNGLEIGLSRTAQWAGSGRRHDLATFRRMMLGQDNPGQGGVTIANEPGNQLAGIDIRFVPLPSIIPLAVYTQWAGEDEAGGLPADRFAIFGAEVWGGLGDSGASWRLHVEFADTLAGFHKAMPMFNTVYEHHIYRSGYRYYGRSIGHSVDGDGIMFSAGGLLIDAAGRTWEILARRIEPNRNMPGAESIMSLALWSNFDIGSNDFSLGAGVNRNKLKSTGARTTDTYLEMQWSRNF